MLTTHLPKGIVWAYCRAGRFNVLSCWWLSFLLFLRIISRILSYFVYINVKFEELLPNKVFNKSVIINKFFVINLGSALKLNFFLLSTWWGIKLPLDFHLDESKAHDPKHFFGVTLKFQSNVERSRHQNLLIYLHLVILILGKRVFGMCYPVSRSVPLVIKP